MSEITSQNLSIMLTDIQGYSDTSSSSSRQELIELIRRHNRLMEPIIKFYRGTVVKSIGDALLCTFPSATDATVCAIIIQLVLKEFNSRQGKGDQKMILRVVINTGDVSLEKGDIYGDAVNITARMEALDCFPGGTIGISEATWLLMNRNEIFAEKIGPRQLKGLPDPVNVYSVPLDKQKLTSIPARLLDLVEQALVIDPAAGGPANESGDNTTAGKTPPPLKEFSTAMEDFLKEANFGQTIGQLGEKIEANISRVGGQLKKEISGLPGSLKKSLAGKSLAEDSSGCQPAPLALRVKSGLIDLALLILLTLILRFAWSFVLQPMVWGRAMLNPEKYNQMITEVFEQRRNSSDFESISIPDWTVTVSRDGRVYHHRPQKLIERLLGLNFRYPLLLVIIYLALMWTVRSATLGQLIAGTAVVKARKSGKVEKAREAAGAGGATGVGGGKIGAVLALKRAVLMVLSLLPLGFGIWTLFGNNPSTFYDRKCQTEVIGKKS